MSLYFITGVPGAGKSEVTRELKARGYEAYDTDDDGFAKWQHNQTGYIHPKSSIKPAARTEEFLQSHSWKVPRQEVEQLAERADGKPIFLCGVAANESEIKDLFKVVFALVVDDETLKHRLQARTNNNDWGKQPHELRQTLEQQRSANESYRNLGHIIIDATQPLDVVVNSIVEKVSA